MNLQTSLFPTSFKELKEELVEKKRARFKELKQMDFLESFEKDWIKRFVVNNEPKSDK